MTTAGWAGSADPPSAAQGRLDSRPAGLARDVDLEPGVHRLGVDGARDALLVVPPGEARPRPLVVFFHGAGGDAVRSLPWIQDAVVAHDVLAVLPTSAGSTWDLIAGGLGRDVAAVDACLDAAFAVHPVSSVAFAGFSDGASYALSLGLANGDLGDVVLAFSPGFLAPPLTVGRPRCWVSHGTDDRVLPIDACGRRVVRRLGDAGYDVTYEEFDGGHVITPDLVGRALEWWLASS